MLRKLLPREVSFFEFFEGLADRIEQICASFRKVAAGELGAAEGAAVAKDIEHAADAITHECVEELHLTFITPIDRSDILALVIHMDDIVDLVEAASVRIELYGIEDRRSEALELAEMLVEASGVIKSTVHELRKLGRTPGIPALCREIHSIENRADITYRTAIACLFRDHSQEPVYIMKWKEILELLEQATDQCEDVADIVQGILIEAS